MTCSASRCGIEAPADLIADLEAALEAAAAARRRDQGPAGGCPVTDLAAQVTAALERSVLPSVIARGGAIRVAAAGTTASSRWRWPGHRARCCRWPPASRQLIRAAVPGITAVRLVTPGTGPAGSPPGAAGDLAEAARAHPGRRGQPGDRRPPRPRDRRRRDGGWIRIRLEGGCQGCSLAEVTIRQGIEPLLRARLPAMTGVADVTDHEAGTEPFFSPEKR